MWNVAGQEHIVFATDYLHPDAKHPHGVDLFLGLKGVTQASQRKILWDNGLRLYNIRPDS